MGNSTLAGFLQSNTVRVAASQLLNLVNNPLVLIGAPPSGFGNLLRSLIVSLEFGTTPFIAPFGSAASLFYGGPARYPVSGIGFWKWAELGIRKSVNQWARVRCDGRCKRLRWKHCLHREPTECADELVRWLLRGHVGVRSWCEHEQISLREQHTDDDHTCECEWRERHGRTDRRRNARSYLGRVPSRQPEPISPRF